MKRRDFIKNNMPLAFAPLFGNQIMASVMNPLSLSAETLNLLTQNQDNILVIINLSGGNDGLATILPTNDVTLLQSTNNQNSLRPPGITDFTSFDTFGSYKINPKIKSITELLPTNGAGCAIIHGVGLSTPNPSHFCAQDVWQCGTNTYSNSVMDNGWIGKFFSTYSNIYTQNAPLAVQIGGGTPRAFMHPDFNKYYGLHPAYSGANLRLNPNAALDCNMPNIQKELDYLRTQFFNTNSFNSQIETAYRHTINNYINSQNPGPTTYLTTSSANTDVALFCSALKTVARLIRGGLGARIYSVNLNGFDTHSNQWAVHNELLEGLSIGIKGFQDDMNAIDLQPPQASINDPNWKIGDRVLGMTFSEFGRRVKANNGGTDHGSTGPMFLFGRKVNSGILGTGGLKGITQNPINSSTNTTLECDYRTVYSAVIEKWFGASSQGIISQPSLNSSLISTANVKGLIVV